MNNGRKVITVTVMRYWSQRRPRPNKFVATVDCDDSIRVVSEQPFLDTARRLLAAGISPDCILEMKHAGSDTVALRSTVGAAAALTVRDPERGDSPPYLALYEPSPYSRATVRIAANDNAVVSSVAESETDLGDVA